MNRKRLVGLSALVCVLALAIPVVHAVVEHPVYGTPLSFTSGATQSSVIVVVSSQNPGILSGVLTLIVDQADGVPRTWPAGRIIIPPGNSTHRVLIPSAITGVRRVVVTNLLH